MKQLRYKVHGLDCAEEVAALRRELLPLIVDDTAISFDLLNAKMTVATDQGKPGPAEIEAAVRRTGMKAIPWERHIQQAEQAQPSLRARSKEVLCAAAGGALFTGFAWHAAHYGGVEALTAGEGGFNYPMLSAALYVAAILLAGVHVFPKAWLAIRALRADMHLLMTVAVAGAIALGNLLEAALVTFLFAVAQLLESWSVNRARHAITALMDLSPPVARYWCPHDKRYEEKPVAEVRPGSMIAVYAGERIPLDGVVIKGETSVDQAPITGESRPVVKRPGDEVFAGAINHDGAIEIETSRPAEDSSIARIIRMVEEAQSRRAPAEQWVDRFARYYTPAMMLLAMAVAVLPALTGVVAWSESIYMALVLLLIACPCALVISTPVSVVAGLTTAARAGILIKGGVYLELPAKLSAMAFDKTGTLTEGRPRVQALLPLNGQDAHQLLKIAAAIESRSQHPLAKAIVRHAEEAGVAYPLAVSHVQIPGKGAEAEVDGTRYWIGSHRLLVEQGFDDEDLQRRARRLEDAGHSVVILGSQDGILGLISVADAVRAEAKPSLDALRKLGITPIVMLTGDNAGTARELARQCGVDEYRHEMLPEDKVREVEALVREHHSVAMVGDGVNDAPALAAASIGIAMGAAGSDAAVETADIALMGDDLSRLPWLIQHSRRTLAIIQQNIAVALGLKVLVLGLAFVGWATLWLAILADMGASLLVIMNALRLLKSRA